MNLQDIETGFPRRNKSATNNTSWNFHKFLPWSTQLLNNDTYDHVYAYFNSDHSVNARDWTAAAQLAAHSQYQNLCNGFISHLFNYTTAVVIWKTQSPWPSLRGFLYDWYLESTGTLRGMRAALGSPVSIAFDPKLWRLRVINRQLFPVTRCADAPIGATYTWIDLHGATVATGEAVLSAKTIAAMSTHLLKENTNLLKWPKGCTDVCLLLLKSTGDCRAKQDFASWHWLTDPALGDAGDYSQLGELRKRQAGNATVELRNCIVSKDGLRLDLRLGIGLSVPDVLFYPTFSIHRLIDGSQLLPVIDSRETDVVLTPGIIQLRRLETSATVEHGERILVVLKSWNAPEIYQYTVCTRSEVPPPPDVKLATTVRQE